MPETYTRHRRTLDRLITQYGRPATIVRIGEGTYDPVTGETTGGGEELFPVQFVETGYQVGLHDSTLIQTGDVLGAMAVPDGVTPVPTDTLRIDSVDHTMVDVKPVSPGEIILQFAFQARR